ncbi:MAG: hypothetical protein LBG52_07520 [Candidatus Peribacteria bacterium]|nr:hypothetical protein [Candidatus Peribacteria bacterium]
MKRTDGKNIYRRNFTGTITATADEQVVTVLLGANIVDSIVDCGGWVIPNSNTMKKTSFPMVSFNTTFISNLSIRAADSALVLGTKYILARTDAPYNIWVEYTKN